MTEAEFRASRTDYKFAQLLAKRAEYKTNHLLHLVLSIITAGLWVPIWILKAIGNSIERSFIDHQLNKLNR